MAKKDLKSVSTDLSALASSFPSQHVKGERVEREKPKRVSSEPEVQFSFSMPQSVRRALAVKAIESDMTMRGFILNALREQGIEVEDEEIADARRKE